MLKRYTHLRAVYLRWRGEHFSSTGHYQPGMERLNYARYNDFYI